jgi:hypothetical protein
MAASIKINRMSITSFISGLVVLLSLGLYRVFYLLTYPPSAVNSQETINRIFLSLMDLTVPVRNLCSAVALLTGLIALREIKKQAGIEGGKVIAWIGILCGAGWILVGLLVGASFYVNKLFN